MKRMKYVYFKDNKIKQQTAGHEYFSILVFWIIIPVFVIIDILELCLGRNVILITEKEYYQRKIRELEGEL